MSSSSEWKVEANSFEFDFVKENIIAFQRMASRGFDRFAKGQRAEFSSDIAAIIRK